MRAIHVKCPNCAASLVAKPGADTIACDYCHTTSAVQRRTRIFQIPEKVAPAAIDLKVARQAMSAVGWIILTFTVFVPLVIVAVVGVVVYTQVRRATSQTSSSASSGSRAASDQAPLMYWQGHGPVLVRDVDGDKVGDLIGRVRYVNDGDRIHLAAFSGTTARKLWESPQLGTYTETYQGRVALVGDVLIYSDPGATLTAYAAADGARRWAATLSDRVTRACFFTAAGAVYVMTADQGWQRFSLADGARTDATPALGACEAVPDDHDGSNDPALLWAEPPRSLKVEGMRVERLVRRGTSGPIVAIGTRSPGTPVATIARLDGARAVWKTEVPAVNPLDVQGAPELVAVTDSRVCAAYEAPGISIPRLTCFDLASGSRLWDAEAAKGTTIVMRALTPSDGRLYLSSWGHLQIYDLETGKRIDVIGEL